MFLGFGAASPQQTVTVTRGSSTFRRPRTDASLRAWQKSHPETSSDLSGLRLIPWNVIHSALLRLNPHFFFAPYGDGRIVICIDEVAPKAAAAHERLSYYEKKDADSVREIKGPRKAIIMASSNAVAIDVELICAAPGHIQVPLARSLITIIKACISYKAFTWEQAERVFGFKLLDVPVRRQHMNMTPVQWSARRDGVISLLSIGD